MTSSSRTDARRGAVQDQSEPDPRKEAWRRVLEVRRSTQRFTGRLRLAVAEVGEQAATDPCLARAMRVMALMIANAGLAREILDGLPLPAEWMEEVV